MTTKRDKNGKAYPAYHVRLKAEQDRKAEIQRNNELIRMLPVRVEPLHCRLCGTQYKWTEKLGWCIHPTGDCFLSGDSFDAFAT